MDADDIIGIIISIISGSAIAATIMLSLSFKDMKECINNDVCVQYYRKYKKYDMHKDSFKIYSENMKEENEK